MSLIDVESTPLAVVRRRTRPSELGTLIPHCCGVVWTFVRSRRIEAGRHVAVYLNGDIDLEVGVEVAGAFPEQGEVVSSRTPAGMVASATHLGPYQGLGAAHEAIRAWCSAHGYDLAGPSWEIYGHWQEAWNTDPSSIRTDVFYQLKGSGQPAGQADQGRRLKAG